MASCRFCFDETATVENPFLSPCDCRGSVQFIHRDCLRHWRSVSETPRFKTHCQLCGALFVIPRRWSYEELPSDAILQSRMWQYLSKPLYSVLFVYYIQIMYIFLNLHRLVEKALPYYDILRPIVPNSRIASLILGLTEVQIVLLVLLGAVTAAYSWFYGRLLWRVQNKKMYFKYILCILEFQGMVMSPLLWISTMLLTGGLSLLVPLPCVVFYVALLPYYMRIHCEILHDMNLRGEA